MTLINVPDSVMELLQREGGELSIQRAGPHNLDWNFAATLTERDEQGHAALLAYGTGSSIAWALYQLTVTLKERREAGVRSAKQESKVPVRGHSITLTLKPEYLSAKFHCHEPLDAKCHEACERPECDEGCVCSHEDREPQIRVYDECLVCTWLTEMGTWEELYNGGPTEAHSGPIDIEWSHKDETWLWHYKETP